MSWRVTIDQRTPGGTEMRHGPFLVAETVIRDSHTLLCDAVEEALEDAGLLHVEVGDFQITATFVS